MHDKNFRVTIPGFYDDVAKLSKAERKALNCAAVESERISQDRGRAGAAGEKGFSIVEQLWTRPTLELNGIWGGYTGEGSKTVIPSKAYAKFSTRLVPNQNPDKITRLARAPHPQAAAEDGESSSWMCTARASRGSRPTRIRSLRWRTTRLKKGFGKRAVFIREGGSIPFVTQMYDTFKVPCILLGFGLPDENAHAPDEHIALENYFGGIKAVAQFYEGLGSL